MSFRIVKTIKGNNTNLVQLLFLQPIRKPKLEEKEQSQSMLCSYKIGQVVGSYPPSINRYN